MGIDWAKAVFGADATRHADKVSNFVRIGPLGTDTKIVLWGGTSAGLCFRGCQAHQELFLRT
jgi:hypothetical protein